MFNLKYSYICTTLPRTFVSAEILLHNFHRKNNGLFLLLPSLSLYIIYSLLFPLLVCFLILNFPLLRSSLQPMLWPSLVLFCLQLCFTIHFILCTMFSLLEISSCLFLLVSLSISLWNIHCVENSQLLLLLWIVCAVTKFVFHCYMSTVVYAVIVSLLYLSVQLLNWTWIKGKRLE